jgi:hypothetical protein
MASNLSKLRPILLIILLFAFTIAKSQTALVTLVDSTKVNTDISSISDKLLLTKAGSFNLTEIYSVRFSSNDEYRKKITEAIQLLDLGVIVYVEGIRQTPIDPVKVAENKAKLMTDKPYGTPITSSDTHPTKSGDFEKAPTQVSAGFGIGQDYGGFGARLTVMPEKHFGLFFGGGYALAGFGYNFGAMVIGAPDKKVSPTFSFMYGYTAAIKIDGASQYNKIYLGPSIGFGLMSKSSRHEGSYWHFGIAVPFRPSEFDKDFNTIKSNPRITGLEKPWPVTISIGYHFVFK